MTTWVADVEPESLVGEVVEGAVWRGKGEPGAALIITFQSGRRINFFASEAKTVLGSRYPHLRAMVEGNA